MKTTLIVILHTLLYSTLAQQPTTVILDSETNSLTLSPKYYSIFEDSTNRLTISEITELRFDQVPALHRQIKKSNSTFWLKVKYTIKDKGREKWLLEALDQHTDILEVFTLFDGKIEKSSAGSNLDFENREFELKNPLFTLNNDPKQIHTIFIKVKSSDLLGFEFRIKQTKSIMEYASKEYFMLGLYYGILFIIGVYNFLVFLSVREKVYLYYILYVIASMFVSFEEDGIGFQFLWPSHPDFNSFLSKWFAPIFFVVSYGMYASSFLQLKQYSKLGYRLIIAIVGGYILLHVANVTIFPHSLSLSDFYFIPFAGILALAIVLNNRGNYSNRYFIIGSSLLFLSTVSILLRENFVIPANIYTVYTFNFGIVLEIMILSFALSDRVRKLRKQKEESQKALIHQLERNDALKSKVNQELEFKVQTRTAALNLKTDELSEANQQLQQMTSKLNSMNEKLDYANWKLGKEVLEEKRSRIQSKSMSFQEFAELYPDEESCLKLLEELKWPNDQFECKKCKHKKYSFKPHLRTHKCSSCGYEESAKAGTLMHGVRFSLQKAFYFTYREFMNDQKLTIDELATLLGIHRNTCSTFRKKIKEKQTKAPQAPTRWEELIL